MDQGTIVCVTLVSFAPESETMSLNIEVRDLRCLFTRYDK